MHAFREACAWALKISFKTSVETPIPLGRKVLQANFPGNEDFLRLRKGVKTREDFWLRLISRGPLQVPETEDPIFVNARERLRVSRMKPELLKALEANMFDRHEYEALEAEAFLKGQARGRDSERKKNDADNAARDSKRADFLRSQNVPDSVIAEMLALK